MSAQFSAGLSLLLKNNTQLSFIVGYAGLGESEVESFSVIGQISIPFGGWQDRAGRFACPTFITATGAI